MRIALFAVGICALAATPAFAQDVARFDGNWNVTQSCSASGDTKAYSMEFRGTVRGGQVTAEHGTSGQAGWSQVTGQIKPNGSTDLSVNGLAGANVNQAVGRTAAGSPYKWRATGSFGDRVGEALSVNTPRPCMLRFVR